MQAHIPEIGEIKNGQLINKQTSTHLLIQHYMNHILEKDAPLWFHENDMFFRARINDSNPYKEFRDKDLYAPPADKLRGGRLNPKGMSYLYMAYEERTAISAVRPYIAVKIGIAQCSSKKTLKIVDFTQADSSERMNNFRKMMSSLFFTTNYSPFIRKRIFINTIPG